MSIPEDLIEKQALLKTLINQLLGLESGLGDHIRRLKTLQQLYVFAITTAVNHPSAISETKLFYIQNLIDLREYVNVPPEANQPVMQLASVDYFWGSYADHINQTIDLYIPKITEIQALVKAKRVELSAINC